MDSTSHTPVSVVVSKGKQMTARVATVPRGLTRFGVVLLASAFVWALGVSAAFAATTPAANVVQQLQRGPLLAFTCTDCHASLNGTNTVTAIAGVKFSHGSHMTYDCTACHARFPHTQAGTERPMMPACFTCHGLRHGPQGLIAGYDCSKCHTKPRSQLIPKDHLVPGFNGKGHILPAEQSLRTSCMMCHTKAQCDTCHFKANVSWVTTQSYTFDPGDSCLACHKTQLPRVAAPVTESNLDTSAHRTLTCVQCHTDFKQTDAASFSPQWNVNAGLSCGAVGCHPKEMATYAKSIHGSTLLSGKDLSSPTCGDCHGGHNIERLKTDAAKTRLRLAGYQMCVGSCHVHDAAYASYSDWYHGNAYKEGNADAPACWTCHGAHDVTAINDPASKTSPENLKSTCGQVGCHQGVTENFAEGWRDLVHGREKDVAANPILALKKKIFGGGK
jgi:hypothetical protein